MPVFQQAQQKEVVAPAFASLAAAPTRLLSLDVMRGLTIVGMILVTDPGTYSAVFPPLLHAAWQGVTPTDMIFPAFLFMVGVSIVFSTQARLRRGVTHVQLITHILIRVIALTLLGLAVTASPPMTFITCAFPASCNASHSAMRLPLCSISPPANPVIGILQPRRAPATVPPPRSSSSLPLFSLGTGRCYFSSPSLALAPLVTTRSAISAHTSTAPSSLPATSGPGVSPPAMASPMTRKACSPLFPPSPARCLASSPGYGFVCRAPLAAKLRICSSSAHCSSSSRGRSPRLCPSTSASGPAPLSCSAAASACFPSACSTGSLIFDLQIFDLQTSAFQTSTPRIFPWRVA